MSAQKRSTQTITGKKNTTKKISMSQQHQLQKKRSIVDGLPMKDRNRLLVVPKSISIVPDRIFTKLVYEGIATLNVVPPAQYALYRYQPSAAFDPDPLLASASTPGFAEFAAFYSSYRVTVSRIRASYVNPSSALAATTVLIPLNVDPGASSTLATVNSWPDQPYAKSGLVGLMGSPPKVLSNEMSTERIYGSQMVYFDDNFASLVTTIPNNNWFWAIAVIFPLVPASTVAVSMQYRIEMGVEFYDRKQLPQ